jgi:hypothetical protein
MRTRSMVVLIALVGNGISRPGHAIQQSSCVFDTAAFRDTVDIWFSLEVHRGTRASKAREILPYAMALAQEYQQPSRVSFRTWPGTYLKESESQENEDTLGGFGLDGMIRFSVDREGRLAGEPQVIHDSPELVMALQEALARAQFPPGDDRDVARIELLIRSRRKLREGVVSFARIPLPLVRLEEEPRMLRPGPQRYPEEEKIVGRSGRVTVYYVITAAGAVLPGSIYAYEATSLAFAESAEAMLMASRFVPGRSGGCALATGVQQFVNFVVR